MFLVSALIHYLCVIVYKGIFIKVEPNLVPLACKRYLTIIDLLANYFVSEIVVNTLCLNFSPIIKSYG